MTTSVHHHHRLMEVGSALSFDALIVALIVALIGMVGTILRSCSSVMANLPHR
jgi:hypothetical protein